MEILRGQIIVYLNLDEVIRIIRESDEPRPELMARWDLSEAQAEAILNMRLRSLRKLEEIELRKELGGLEKEEDEINRCSPRISGNGRRSRGRSARPRRSSAARPSSASGGRRSASRRQRSWFGRSPRRARAGHRLVLGEGLDPHGQGHNGAGAEVKYKEGDAPRFVVPVETTDRLVVFGTNGRFYTLPVDRLPGGRGHGEPLRLMIDLPNEHDIVALFPYRPEQKLLLAASDGRGFICGGEEALAQTRTGKQVLVPGQGAQARICLRSTATSWPWSAIIASS